jgi:hypothetical protein
MDVSQNDDTIVIDDKNQSEDPADDQVVCIYPEHQSNGVTVRLNDYESLEDICI